MSAVYTHVVALQYPAERLTFTLMAGRASNIPSGSKPPKSGEDKRAIWFESAG
jgi:hypothetical protein